MITGWIKEHWKWILLGAYLAIGLFFALIAWGLSPGMIDPSRNMSVKASNSKRLRNALER